MAPCAKSAARLASGSYASFEGRRDSHLAKLEGHLHKSASKVRHDAKGGVSYRIGESAASERWGRDNLVQLAGENFGTPFDVVRLIRPENTRVTTDDLAIWVQDAIEIGDLRLDVGIRSDHQVGRNEATAVDANPLFPNLLPGTEVEEGSTELTWSSVLPRLSFTWALGSDGRTVLRAGLAGYSSQLRNELVSRVSPGSRAEVLLGYQDLDSNDRFDLHDDHFLLNWKGIDLLQASGSANRTSLLLRPERTDEIRLSLERSLRSDMVLGLELERRNRSNVLEARRIVRDPARGVRVAHAEDYVLDTFVNGVLPDGGSFVVPVYALREGLEYTGGNLLVNGDRSQVYEGITLSFNKRLANRWMLRAHGTWSDWRWRGGSLFETYDDPTDQASAHGDDAGVSIEDNTGDVVVQHTGQDGESGARFLNSQWSFNVSSLVQVAPDRPWGFNVAANFHGREGYPIPYAVSVLSSDQEVRTVQVTPETDSYRLDDAYTLDVRLDKELRFDELQAVVYLDAFNLLNRRHVLERDRSLDGPWADAVRDIQSPRAFRLGIRLAID